MVADLVKLNKMNSALRPHRAICWTCRQPAVACYCADVRPFDSGIDFVILIHPLEARRRIATGRMAHAILRGSRLIEGDDFSSNQIVEALIADPNRQSLILYPHRSALDLDDVAVRESLQQTLDTGAKRLTIFIIDGTWATARKMMRLSHNLRKLPMIKFQPEEESRFQVRKQPAKFCLSTIEAIHATLERVKKDQTSRAHDHLLDVFLKMVERQKQFVPRFKGSN